MWVQGLHDYWFEKGDMQTIMDKIAEDITAGTQRIGYSQVRHNQSVWSLYDPHTFSVFL